MLLPLVPQESGEDRFRQDNFLRIRDAETGKTFPWRLEYNCPVHEHWNIVHTGMLIPECRQIYICPDNCLRGVVMTADEMDAADRISSVMPDEREIQSGNLEQLTIDGVADVIRKLPDRPRAVQLFPVCMHHLLGCDMHFIAAQLRKQFPDIDFMECFMDPVCQKLTTTPEQRQRFQMMKVLADHPRRQNFSTVSMLGENLRVGGSDIPELLAWEGVRLLEVQDCGSYDEYLDMGASFLWLTRSPLSKYGLERAGRLAGRRTLYLPDAVDYDEIDTQERSLLHEVHEALENTAFVSVDGTDSADVSPEKESPAGEKLIRWSREQRMLTEKALEETRREIGGRPIVLDYVACPRPLGWARLLLTHGFDVRFCIADSISPEEQGDLDFLKEEYPDLPVMSSQSPASLYERERSGAGNEILAIGPKAAYFAGTGYFVNVIEQDGVSGYRGIRHMLELLREAAAAPKNTEIVTGKGLGLPGVWNEVGYEPRRRP